MYRYSGRKPLTVDDIEQLYGTGESESYAYTQYQLMVRRTISSMFITALQTLLLFLIISSLIGRFEIQQTSMEPTFHEGQRVVVSQFNSTFPSWLGRTAHAAHTSPTPFGLKRGHVVVFYDTPEAQGAPLIKRLIGLPGDTIEIRDGHVFINNQQIDEPYISQDIQTTCHTYCGPMTLQTGTYFFMGDNRSGSRDSRSFGPIPEEQIIGRVIVRYWPPSKFTMYE